MKLPPFAEFTAELDNDKLRYDIYARTDLTPEEVNEAFNSSAWSVMCRLIAGSTSALLQQYHQWLAEKLE